MSDDERGPKERGLLDITEDTVKGYGAHTIEERALPDFRDGFKPVHRRIMWSLFKEGRWHTLPTKKNAGIVGDVISKYHPHGDTAIADALAKMGNLSVPLIDTQGNYGNVFEGDAPAAYRYIECRLSKYAQTRIVNPDYMAVAKLHPNFDGEHQEPLYLPAIVPNLLINGAYGIAMGATGVIPPFHPDGVFELTERALNGETVTAKACLKKLRLNYPSGGSFSCGDDVLLEFYKVGKGGLTMQPDFTIDSKNRLFIITGAPFGITKDKVIDRLSTDKRVAPNGIRNLMNGKNNIYTVIKLKNTVPENEVPTVARDLISKINYTLATSVSITERLKQDETDFFETNIPNLIHKWAQYRIDLEKTVQTHKIAVIDNKIANNNLFILAANNRKIILQALESSNPDKVIQTKLKITAEQSKQILDMAIRRLSKLSQDDLEKDIRSLQKDKKAAIEIKKNPQSRIKELLSVPATPDKTKAKKAA